jgi:hypothetical protein
LNAPDFLSIALVRCCPSDNTRRDGSENGELDSSEKKRRRFGWFIPQPEGMTDFAVNSREFNDEQFEEFVRVVGVIAELRQGRSSCISRSAMRPAAGRCSCAGAHDYTGAIDRSVGLAQSSLKQNKD